MANKIQLRRDTAANWARINPILADGELGLDITNNKIKAGDGNTHWVSLPYVAAPAGNQLVNGNKVLSVDTSGNVNLPGSAVLSTVGGNLNINGATNYNVNIVADSNGTKETFKFGSNGVFTLPNNSTVDDSTGNLTLNSATNSNVSIRTNVTGGYSEWKFGSDGNLTVPANGVITTSQGYTGNSFDIIGITSDVPAVVNTYGDHALTSGTNILISGITTMTELNGREFYVTTPSSSTLALYEDPNCTIPVDSTGYTNYTGYTGRTLMEIGGSSGFATDTSPAGSTQCKLLQSGYYLGVPSGDDLTIGANDDFTIEFFAKFSAGDLSMYAGVVGSSDPSDGINIIMGGGASGIFKGNQGGGGAWVGGIFNNVYLQLVSDTWYHIAWVRNAGLITVYVNGTGFTNNGTNTTAFNCNTPMTIGWGVGYGTQGTKLSNFRIVIGTAVYTSNFTAPTTPLTKITNTKLLLPFDGNLNDISNNIPTIGGGTLLSEYAGADLTIALDSPGNTDPGSIILVSKNIALRVNGRDNQLELNNPGGVYPINSSGQHTITLAHEGSSATYTNIPTNCNLIYIQPDMGFDSSGLSHNVVLDYPSRPGIEVTIINDSQYSINIDTMDAPPYVMVAWENIKLMSFRWPGDNQCYWWITDSFSWNY